MSASQQKKSRQEKKAAYMSERARQEAKEAKKLKVYTTTFWIIMALCACIVLTTVLSNPVKNALYKKHVAITVGEHELNAVQLNYYYIDAINNYYSQYGSYLSYMGLNVNKPLDTQVYDSTTGQTWADAFLTMAEGTIKSTYALYDLALKNGYELSEEDEKSIDSTFSTLELYAMYYGYSDVDSYLRVLYGNGASSESYREYTRVALIAENYYTEYADSLDYSNEDIRNYESANNNEKYNNFSSLTYATYYLAYTKWTPSKDASGNTVTYTDEQKNEARAEAKKAAEMLAGGSYADLDAFDAAIKALEINKDATTGITCSRNEDILYTSISNADFQKWLTEEGRKEGDMTVIENSTGEGDSKVINGYYVIRFGSINENKFALKNVHHILIGFEGGKYNSTTGQTTYTDAEKKAALDKAEKIYKEWKESGASLEDFIDLAKEHSTDPGSKEEGGLYEDIYPGQMVEKFEEFCYDAARQPGDHAIIETTYGYHIMYFVGDSDITFRDYMIKNTLINEHLEAWLDDLVENLQYKLVSDKYVNKDLILGTM